MDGYAVAGDGPWAVVGRVLAGAKPPAGPLNRGECLEVATGAAVPSRADAVLAYEEVDRDGDLVQAPASPRGRHIRRRGEGCLVGTTLLPQGRLVTPAVLGLAASVGHDTLTVTRRPRVRVVLSGDEVVSRGLPRPGSVRDAVGPMLPGLVGAAGGVLVGTQGICDDPDQLIDSLREPEADVVVVCGGSSVGPADHLPMVLSALGAETLVPGVACRPGHPQVLARTPDGRWIVGLPGNPFAALAGALTLLGPLLARCSGRAPLRGPSAHLEGEVRAHSTDTRLVAVARTGSSARPVGHDRPGSLWGAALADSLAVVPPGWTGEPVELLPLPGAQDQQPSPGNGNGGHVPPG
jgi:molybdopterin molybdotransferase